MSEKNSGVKKEKNFSELIKNAKTFDTNNLLDDDSLSFVGILQKSTKPDFFVLVNPHSNSKIRSVIEIQTKDVDKHEVLKENSKKDKIVRVYVKPKSLVNVISSVPASLLKNRNQWSEGVPISRFKNNEFPELDTKFLDDPITLSPTRPPPPPPDTKFLDDPITLSPNTPLPPPPPPIAPPPHPTLKYPWTETLMELPKEPKDDTYFEHLKWPRDDPSPYTLYEVPKNPREDPLPPLPPVPKHPWDDKPDESTQHPSDNYWEWFKWVYYYGSLPGGWAVDIQFPY